MRALIQRSARASVIIDRGERREVGPGLVVFLGITHGDNEANADYLVDKIAGLRIFRDESGKMNLSIRDTDGECLIVSQFTLYGDTRKGRRPSFIDAALPAAAEPLYRYFVKRMRESLVSKIQTGEFGADMLVEIANDGPVTLMMESPQ